LNEALAHLVELRASGSDGNLKQRINRFLSHPESSPLVVRDYGRSGYWRHDGCRGAAYLFLQWCVDQAGDELISRLINGSDCGLNAVETAMSRPLPDLFREWTYSLGFKKARSIADGTTSATNVAAEHWPLVDAARQQGMTIQGTSCAFLYIDGTESQTAWDVRITGVDGSQLQATLIEVPASER
jgi:hypothetical protein